MGLIFASLVRGEAGTLGFGELVDGFASLLGIGDTAARPSDAIVELRLSRTLVALGVGASLGLSGALLQGVFRNDLASPAVLGVTTGASLGAALAILATGGYGPLAFVGPGGAWSPVWVSLAAFAGAVGVLGFVTAIGTRGGVISIPTLLLAGLAVNAVVGGLLAAIQSFALSDFDLARALLSWGFGRITDHGIGAVATLFASLAVGASVIPFVASELDLFQASETDAARLGVDVRAVKFRVLGAAGLLAGVSVATVGQIAFVGLLVPHLVRLVVGRSNTRVLALSAVGGGLFLVACDLLQREMLDLVDLRTGVWMSVIGGPAFLLLLVRQKESLESW